MAETRQRIIAIVKCLWYMGAAVFVALYLYNNSGTIHSILKHISWSNIILAIMVLIAGKICLSENMRYSLLFIDRHIPFIRCFYIYNISQLGKYIPGNFWHFLGRIGFYKEEGLSFKEVRSAMLLEIGLIIGGSFFFGALFLLFSPGNLKILPGDSPSARLILLFVFIGFVVSSGFIFLIKHQFLKNALKVIYDKRGLNYKILFVQLLLWLFLGISFFFIVSPYQNGYRICLFAIGLFALAYLIGFLFIIAPAGIGVREFILISGLSLINIQVDVAISLVGLHRVLYVIVEVLLAISGMVISFFSKKLK